MEDPDCIKVTSTELDGYIKEIETSSLKCKDVLIKIIYGHVWIQQQLERSQLTIGKLKKCFQITTEKWFRKGKKKSKKKTEDGTRT